MSWAMSAPSTRPSRRRTATRCCSCPSSASARAASSAAYDMRAARPRRAAAGSRSTPSAARSASSTGARASPARTCSSASTWTCSASASSGCPAELVGQRRRARCAHRRRAGAGLGAELRPGRLHRRPAARASGGAARQPAHAAGQQVHPRPVPAGLDLQDDDGAGRAGGRRDHARRRGLLPRLTQLGSAASIAGRSTATAASGMVQALGQSCDVYFYEMARRVGIDAIAAMARRFGLGAPARHRPAGRAAGLMPTTRLEAGDARRELAEGRDAGLRHRPGLRAGDAAAAGDDGGAAGQWRAARSRPGSCGRRPDAGAAGTPLGVPQRHLDVVLARHARGRPRRARHRPRGGPACPASRWPARPAPRRCAASRGPSGPRAPQAQGHALGASATTRCSSASLPMQRRAMPSRWWSSTARAAPGRGADRPRHHAQGAGARPARGRDRRAAARRR